MGLKLEKLVLPSAGEIDALDLDALNKLAKQWRERLEIYQQILFKMRRRQYGPSSERSAGGNEPPTAPAPRSDTTKQPSERYPNARVEVEDINFPTEQVCPVCGGSMHDSGMSEVSEYVDVTSKEFTVVEQRRHKHRCTKCHGSIVTAPLPARIIPGGSYSDEMIVDATLSKFCDLIPMERYCQMASRGGFPGLPPHSLIRASLRLADFLDRVYQLIKEETLSADILLADETPHRMLEGDEKKRWYLWGFSDGSACFFECHDTRSGDVSTEVLKASSCKVLVSDVYSGYGKSLKITNKQRLEDGKEPIAAAYCNAHARREFHCGNSDTPEISSDAKFMVDEYKKIYKLWDETEGLLPEENLLKRQEMKPHFEAMKDEALKKIDSYSSKSQMGSAYNYFLKNYEGLTLFLTNPIVPPDNNTSERLLRSHVVGRKTWYGTHSRAGAAAAAVHFSIVETCKLNGVNPRKYYMDMINQIHCKRDIVTPRRYKQELSNTT